MSLKTYTCTRIYNSAGKKNDFINANKKKSYVFCKKHTKAMGDGACVLENAGVKGGGYCPVSRINGCVAGDEPKGKERPLHAPKGPEGGDTQVGDADGGGGGGSEPERVRSPLPPPPRLPAPTCK